MAILDLFRKTEKPPKRRVIRPPNHSRMFNSATSSNLFSGFNGTSATADEEIYGSLQMMRNRARQVCQDNELARKFLAMVKSNVVLNGIKFQARTRREDGSLDELDNSRLERGWAIWGDNPDFCSMDGRNNFTDLCRQVMETIARDGEAFIRIMKPSEGNPFGFSLWVIEADAFPIQLNKTLDADTAIVMAIEQDRFGRPLAYHQTLKTPGINSTYAQGKIQTERVPASEIIHLYIQDRPGQSRGIPWLNTAIKPLDMLQQYQLSELTSSRISSSAMGFFTSPTSDAYVGTGVDDDQNLITEFEPGTFQQLPEGMDFKPFDPMHPTTAYKDFVKSIMRSVASGLLVNYNSLSNDLESVNYSSIRAGQAEEKSQWKMLQDFFIKNFCGKVYKEWLRMAITSNWFAFDGQANLPMSKISKFENVRWIPRGWPYVNPEQEIKAQTLGVELGVETLTDIASASGKDWDEVVEQLAYEKEIIDRLGLKFPNQPLGQPVSKNVTEVIDVDEEKQEENGN